MNDILKYSNGDIYQWDSGLSLTVNGQLIDEAGTQYVHYQHKGKSAVYSVAVTDGTAAIPNELLQVSGAFNAYAYVLDESNGKTLVCREFRIVPRPQPPEYIYDPTPVITYPELVQLVEDLNALKTKLTMVDAMAETLPSGELATATVDDSGDGLTFIFGIPGGEQGTPGRGIRSIVKEGSEGLVDHYVINYTDDTVSDFLVTNGADGNGIVSIVKTATVGLVDTYTIAFTNGTTTTFNVTNGKDGEDAVIDPTLSHEGEAADAKATGDAIADVMQSDKGSTSNGVYTTRQTASQNFCSREKLQKIIGGTVVQNQLFDFTQGSSRWRSNGSITQTWNDGTLTLSNGSTNAAYAYQIFDYTQNHKVMYWVDAKDTLGEGVTTHAQVILYFGTTTVSDTVVLTLSEERKLYSGIVAKDIVGDFKRLTIRPSRPKNTVTVYGINLFDLTEMFGTAIADYAYTLESATAGSGIAWLRNHGFFTEFYYAYSAPTLVSVSGLVSHDTTDATGATRSYPLDSTLTLRGIPTLTSAHEIEYNGDEYLPDGTVIRRFGYRTYQSGDESLANAITDGTNTVYLLSNPTTEQAEPYQETQVCDALGTEAFVGASIPVGAQTFYPIDLKQFVESFSDIPQPPTAAGTYTLKCVVTASGKTFRWSV